MHKIVLAVAVAAVALLVLAGTAAAGSARVELGARAAHHISPAVGPPGAAVAGDAAATRFVPLGRVLAGNSALAGNVYDYFGTAVASASLRWWTWDGTNGWQTGTGTTAVDGSYTMTGVYGAAGTGEVWAYAPDDTWSLGYYDQTWPDTGTQSYVFRPGKVPFTVYRWGSWKDWNSADLYVWTTENGPARAWTEAQAPYTAGQDTWTGDALALQGGGNGAVVRFWFEEGVEVPVTPNVSAGATSTGLTVSEADAQRTLVWAPYWASGKPGTTAKLWLNHFPTGRVTEVEGYSDYPSTAPVTTFADHYSNGAEDQFTSRKVSTKAKPGYFYIFGLRNANGHLYIATAFQVATLNASRTAIHKGGSVRLSGVIPTQDHWGGQAGISKRVVVWKRTSAAGPPQRPGNGSTLRGWTRVGSYRADGYGRFHTGYLHPTRSTWYIVWYPGDNWYWGAFTSVRKVAVR